MRDAQRRVPVIGDIYGIALLLQGVLLLTEI